jgi:hypothetical protein
LSASRSRRAENVNQGLRKRDLIADRRAAIATVLKDFLTTTTSSGFRPKQRIAFFLGKRTNGRVIAAIAEVPNSNLGRYPYHYHCIFHKSARAPGRNMLSHKPPYRSALPYLLTLGTLDHFDKLAALFRQRFMRPSVQGAAPSHSCGFYPANQRYDLRLIQDYLGRRDLKHAVQPIRRTMAMGSSNRPKRGTAGRNRPHAHCP